MTLVSYVRERVVIKCHCMWPINSFDLISYSICVVDTIIFKRSAISFKNKRDLFCAELGSQGLFPLSQKWAAQLSVFYDLFQMWGAVVFFIHDVYADWNIRCISYCPICYSGRQCDFIWWYAPYRIALVSCLSLSLLSRWLRKIRFYTEG